MLQVGTLGTLRQFPFKSAVFMEQKSSFGVWSTFWDAGCARRMAKPEDYRRYAAECLRLAQVCRDRGEAAALLLEMAERWRRLALEVENRVSQES